MKQKILILYFSGTGNTNFIAHEVYNFLTEKSFNVTIKAYESFDVSSVKQYSHVITGSPINACEVPPFFHEYITSLDFNSDAKIFLFSTMGLYEGIAHIHLARDLEKRGHHVVDSHVVIMPGSDGLAMMKPESPMLQKMINKDFKNLPSLNELKNKVHNFLTDGAIDKKNIYNKIIRRRLANALMAPIYKWAEKFMLKRFRVREDACTHCKICLKNCPSKNISEENGSITFHDKCYYCLRCLHQCPEQAIEIGNYTFEKFRYKGPLKNFKGARMFKM